MSTAVARSPVLAAPSPHDLSHTGRLVAPRASPLPATPDLATTAPAPRAGPLADTAATSLPATPNFVALRTGPLAATPDLAAPVPAPRTGPLADTSLAATPNLAARVPAPRTGPLADTSLAATPELAATVPRLRTGPFAATTSLADNAATTADLPVPPAWRRPLPGPRLRSLLVSTAERARHPQAEARELAPGLHELIALRCADGGLQIPGRGELRFHGLDAAAAFVRARIGTCGEPLEFGRAGPLPGVHAYILGGPGGSDTTVAALELRARFGATLGPAGLVLAVPARGTALFLAPHARGLCRALAQIGRFRQFWCSDGDAAPPRVPESLRFLATWAANAHARLPDPVSPALYWQRPGHPLTLLAPDAGEPLELPALLLHDP